jgi:hypothetical protein
MTIKQSYSNLKDKEEIKSRIIQDRLSHLFKENGKSLAKILMFLLKKHRAKKVVDNV